MNLILYFGLMITLTSCTSTQTSTPNEKPRVDIKKVSDDPNELLFKAKVTAIKDDGIKELRPIAEEKASQLCAKYDRLHEITDESVQGIEHITVTLEFGCVTSRSPDYGFRSLPSGN
jgi:hypothetical protein